MSRAVGGPCMTAALAAGSLFSLAIYQLGTDHCFWVYTEAYRGCLVVVFSVLLRPSHSSVACRVRNPQGATCNRAVPPGAGVLNLESATSNLQSTVGRLDASCCEVELGIPPMSSDTVET